MLRLAVQSTHDCNLTVSVQADQPCIIVTDSQGFEVWIAPGATLTEEDIDGSVTQWSAWKVYGLSDFQGGDSTRPFTPMDSHTLAVAVIGAFLKYAAQHYLQGLAAQLESLKPQI